MGVVRSSQCKDSSAIQLRPDGWLQDYDSEQSSKDGWLGSPNCIPIFCKQQEGLDLLDLGEQLRRLS